MLAIQSTGAEMKKEACAGLGWGKTELEAIATGTIKAQKQREKTGGKRTAYPRTIRQPQKCTRHVRGTPEEEGTEQ